MKLISFDAVLIALLPHASHAASLMRSACGGNNAAFNAVGITVMIKPFPPQNKKHKRYLHLLPKHCGFYSRMSGEKSELYEKQLQLHLFCYSAAEISFHNVEIPSSEKLFTCVIR